MNMSDYQIAAKKTALYPPGVLYPALGLCGEAGEVAEKIKKAWRNYGSPFSVDKDLISKELGDVLWYVAALATEFGLDMNDIAALNIKKLQDRQERGVIKNEGDNR